MGHDNAARLRTGYEAFSKGDLDTVRGLWSPDIRWHSYGNSPFSGEYQGIDQVFGDVFARIPQETEAFELAVHSILADDEHGVAMVDQMVRRNDRVFNGKAIHVYHFDRDGLVTEAFIQPVDEDSVPEDFWD